MSVPIKVDTLGIEPFVTMTENYTQNYGSTAYRLTGLSVEILKFVCQKMNLKTLYLAPLLIMEMDSYLKEISELDEGLSDVLTGLVLLLPVVVTFSFDATIPYIHENMKMLVPCPKAIPETEKLMTNFSVSVWLTTDFLLLLSTAVFWCAGNVPYRSVCNVTHTYQSLSHCFHNAWAVFMGVAVPQQSTTSTLRVFFIMFLCFCFAINTVFQAFFVSYLVEPKYENKLEKLDYLLDSDVVYDFHRFFSLVKALYCIPN